MSTDVLYEHTCVYMYNTAEMDCIMLPPAWWIHDTDAIVQLNHTHLVNDRDDCEVSLK